MEKIFTLLSVGALFAASAATLSNTSGTTFAGLTAGDAFSASGAAAEGGKYYWYSADAQSGTNMSLAANYYGGACGRPNQFAEAETSIALAVDAENLLYRAAEGSASAFSSPSFTQVDLGDGGLYIDTLIKFEQCRDEADIADDAGKLAVWLNSTSNLVITAGKYSGENFSTNDYEISYLDTDACNLNPDTWYRLTVKAKITNGKMLFTVYIDGKQASTTGGLTEEFPSLVPTATQLSALAFQGEGAVDDISFTEDIPNFLFVGVAQIGDTYYETLADALAAVNYGQTIVLIADPGVTSVTLPKTGISLSDPNGYLSTVTGPNGQEVTASENVYTLPLTAVNPVTGETETYENAFIGGTAEWNSAANWDTSTTPFITTTYSPALVNGKTASTSAAIDGWTLRVGAYNGAAVTWAGGITKIQAGSAGCWLTADETSSITIASFAGNQLEGSDAYPFKLSSANAGGITWSAGLTSASNTSMPFWYYLKGTGTVVYGGDITVANAQVIKMADVTLSGNEKSVQSKTLVSFGSGTTKTFTADAAIKVKNSSDEVVRTVNLSSVNSTGTTTLTTDNAVGMCELVQTTTGILLFWVDGDPSDIKEYKPSININFTNGAGNGLTTSDDVGLEGYAVPGTSWNNFTIPNNANEQTFNTVNSIDSTGAASVAAGVSVKVSGHRGSYSCSGLSSANNPLHGYIDEGAEKTTPAVTITGIPYEHYRVIVYHSTDQNRAKFGYDTINGFNFTYVDGVQQTGTTSWGSAGADQSAEPIAEGTNTLVSAVLSGDTVTMVAHRVGGATPTARGCFAAIQVVQYVPEVGENDLVIEVSGPTTYTVSEERTLSGTVYVVGSGTLTLAGSEKITAATIDVAKDVAMNINADRLDATTFTGSGTVVYDTTAPVEGKGWANIGWSGTVWIKNQSVSSFEGTKFGNAASTIRFTGVTGYLQTSSWNGSTYVHTVPLELVDEGNTVAFTYSNGWGGNLVKINTLKGTGTLKTQGSGAGEHIYIVDASDFTGAFNLSGKYVYVGGSQPDYSASANPNGKLEIRSGVTMTVPSGKTWTANGGFVVNGTLVANGTLASSASSAVSGSGTVVFGGVPSPTGDTWWKNAAWTGTVEIQGVTALNGDYNFNDYGNSGSTLKLTNCRGWLKPNYTCVPALEIGGTFAWNDGSSGLNNTFKVATLKGSGTISIPNNGAATAVWQITDDWSGFTGPVVGNNGAAKRILVFGPTLPATITAGDIYISEGATLDLDNSSGAWWGVGMRFVVDGTVKASSRSKWGGGTAMVLGDTGVLEFVSSSNTNDENTEMGNITGTGTLKFSSSAGWRAYPKVDANMPAATLTIQSELADSLILPTKNNGETVIGSLAGSKNIRSDWSDNGANGRILTVTQSKDTEWQGKFVSNRITQFNVVAPAVGTPGTLTLSGTQTVNIPAQIDGSVNLTGTWVGATTVAGTIGGTGTLTGDLTFSAGSTFKAFASDENGLSVSGSIAYPASGTVTVDVSALGTPAAKVILLTAASESDIDLTKFALADGTNRKYKLAKEGATLVLKGARKGVMISVY